MRHFQLSTTVITYLLYASLTNAEPWNCKFNIGKARWDLTSLNTEKTVSQTRTTPPSSFLDEVRFNLCEQLKEREGVPGEDQCPKGTIACLTETNKKEIDGPDRITTVIPLASTSNANADTKLISNTPSKGVTIILHGPSYPSSTTPSIDQSISFTLQCSQSDESPRFISYDPSKGVMAVEWNVKAACPLVDDGGKPDDNSGKHDPPPNEPTPSGGIWTFFILLCVGIAAYFGIGAYHNYNNYGASGWDLIPHRDFWREVPYLFQDLVSHLCSSVRPGGSRSGYVSV